VLPGAEINIIPMVGCSQVEIDNQTAFGKTIAGIAPQAKYARIPVIMSRSIVENADKLHELGVTDIFPICQSPISIEQAMAEAPVLLQNIVERVMQKYRKVLSF